MLVAALLLFDPSTRALAWGERGHKMVNAAAVENLPEPFRSYFRARKTYLVEHAVDPDRLAHDNAEERPHHYTDLDVYDAFPFSEFRRQFVDEKASSPTVEIQRGDSIWQIERFTLRLAEAFRRRHWGEIDRNAVFAAHYAADLTQPLHTIINYDGQLNGQKGIHARFETDLVNALSNDWELHPQPPALIADLRARIFDEMTVSYSCRNVVFASDHIAVSGRNYLDPQYSLTFDKLAGLLARKRLETAASFIGSLWYTAWVRAGKPAMRSVPATGTVGGVPVRGSP